MTDILKYEIETARRVWYWALIALVNAIVLTLIPAVLEKTRAIFGHWAAKGNYPTAHLESMMDVVPAASLLAGLSVLYACAILSSGERANAFIKKPANFVVDSFVLFLATFLGICSIVSLYEQSIFSLGMFFATFLMIVGGYFLLRLMVSELPRPTTWPRRIGLATLYLGVGVAIPMLLA